MNTPQIIFLVLLFLSTCQIKPVQTEQEATKLQDVNKVLWERILKNPDSVYVHFKGLDLLISGEITKDGFSPLSLTGKINSKSEFSINELIGNWEEFSGLFYLFYEDVNFDGKKDLGFLSNYGATGNYWYSFWIFDATENKFIYNDYYSGMPSPIIDTLNKRIQTYYRMGYCDELIYIIENDNVIERIYTQNETTKTGSNCWCITEKLNDSVWRETDRKIIYQSLHALFRKDHKIISNYL
jgi:hypothetical protein